MRRATFVHAVLIGLAAARVASAQGAAAGRVEISGGVTWIGSASAGSADATESTASGGTSTIFTTSSTLTAAPGLRVTAGVRATRTIEIEAVASYGKPALEVALAGDIENAAPATASETITQYTLGGGALWFIPSVRSGDRLRVFVAGHAAYLRQLHEGNTLAVNGQAYDFGGGIKYLVPVGRSFWIRAYGMRADAGVAARSKGVLFGSGTRFSPAASASFVARF